MVLGLEERMKRLGKGWRELARKSRKGCALGEEVAGEQVGVWSS